MKRYRKATSYSRSVQLLGYTVGSVLGQLLVSFDLMSYNNIMVFTLILIAIALFTSCFLPMPQQSMFFHRKHPGERTATEVAKKEEDRTEDATKHASSQRNEKNGNVEQRGEMEEKARKEQEEKEGLEESGGAQTCSKVLFQLGRDFCQCYSSRQLLCWSLWWAMATCAYNQTVNYVQVSYKGKTVHVQLLLCYNKCCNIGPRWASKVFVKSQIMPIGTKKHNTDNQQL